MEQETRNRLFKFICIPLRILIIVLLVLFASNDTFRYIASGICFFLSADFTTKYMQKRMVGTLFGGFAWWHPNRLKHAFLFLLTGVLLLLKYEWAGYILAGDVCIAVYSYSLKETAKSIEDLDIPAF